jgi:rhodanese-related sulfurtransferase
VNYKRLVGSILVIVVLLAALVSCGSPAVTPSSGVTPSPSSGNTVNEFEVIRKAADAYLSSGKAEKLEMSVDLHTIINDNDPKNDPRILEARDFKQHILGHICNAVNVPWRQLFLTLTPDKFDVSYFSDHDKTSDNKQIVVYSYTGQEGGGVTVAALNMMGFDAISLKWGYNQWQFCPNASPGPFFEASTGLGRVTVNSAGFTSGFNAIGMDYPTETTASEATKTYKSPVVENTDSDDPWEIIRAAATEWGQKEEPLTPAERAEGGFEQKHRPWDTDIIPVDLFNLLHDADPSNNPFILSVQPKDLYAKGHIPGAVWMPITDVCKPENLEKLPTDRKIVVVSNDGQSGSQVSGILALLGYDAVNLLFGMTAWTYSDVIAPGRFHVYAADNVTFQDVIGYEICWIETPVSEMLPPIEGYQPPNLAPVEVGEF